MNSPPPTPFFISRSFPTYFKQCSFEFESWSLNASVFTFNQSSKALVDSAFASPQWFMCNRSTLIYNYTYGQSNDGNTESFTRLRFDIAVRRKSTFYIINLIFPISILSIIQMLTFAIPSKQYFFLNVLFFCVELPLFFK